MQERDKDYAQIKIRGVDDMKIFSLSLHSIHSFILHLSPHQGHTVSSAVGHFCWHRWNGDDVIRVEFPTPYTTLHVNMWRCFLYIFKHTALKPTKQTLSTSLIHAYMPSSSDSDFQTAHSCCLVLAVHVTLVIPVDLWLLCIAGIGQPTCTLEGTWTAERKRIYFLQNHWVANVGKMKESTH